MSLPSRWEEHGMSLSSRWEEHGMSVSSRWEEHGMSLPSRWVGDVSKERSLTCVNMLLKSHLYECKEPMFSCTYICML